MELSQDLDQGRWVILVRTSEIVSMAKALVLPASASALLLPASASLEFDPNA